MMKRTGGGWGARGGKGKGKRQKAKAERSQPCSRSHKTFAKPKTQNPRPSAPLRSASLRGRTIERERQIIQPKPARSPAQAARSLTRSRGACCRFPVQGE